MTRPHEFARPTEYVIILTAIFKGAFQTLNQTDVAPVLGTQGEPVNKRSLISGVSEETHLIDY